MNAASSKNGIRKDTTKLLIDGIILGGRRCPDCGSRMTEVDRVQESGSIFVWYKCENGGCDGRWLQKYQSQMDAAV